MPVFISYRHTDRDLATRINNRLQQFNVQTYFDVLDAESQSTDNITEVITRNITECTHLLAVISYTTAQSWWVPFEIGEATISGRRISSFQVGHEALPLYLEKWPKMSNTLELDLFIEEYRRESSKRSIGMESMERATAGSAKGVGSADQFHKTLKERIRRGY
ncbi:toll/interleukin-1 receptor domain-containing protein [Pseudomonas abieticivorans]|uniref:toll/interleukin-1 receptor domain-containing protein n=1 Tax=Pseudomonas abieticivorans TaxID=2931382 RepID=UPI0020C12D31|nr:toll/interleukin-1 receptor domain-containing protein [Pseudomonas sp. PIA16]